MPNSQRYELIMQTQCPHCQTIFRITAAHLNLAQGHARCSHCQHIFNATNHLLQQLPEQTAAAESFHTDDDEHIIGFQQDNFQEDDVPELLQDDIYDPPRGRAWKSFFFWGIMVIVLTATLTAQGLWIFQRDSVLQHPKIRPLLEQFCYTFLCTLPLTRDLKRFEMQNHIAQVHPDIDDVIQFEATFINNAIFPQPYPDLQLTFEDFNGNPLAQRRFKPAEYLPPLGKNPQMRSKASVHIKLDLIELASFIEGNNVAEGYRFEFF